MPAEVLSDFKWEPYPKPSRSFRFAIAMVLATLSAIALALVRDPDASAERMASDATPSAAATDAREPVLTRRERAEETEIDALTGAVSRRYRVSDSAMREVVLMAYQEARRNRLDPLLVVAIIAIESRFNPFAQSDMGALGLMQVIPQYHAEKFDADDGESILDPRVNIRVGARVLREYIARAGTEVAGLQLYNGSGDDASNAYANKIAAEKLRLQAAMRRVRAQSPGPIA